jgi:hypothetical protein
MSKVQYILLAAIIGFYSLLFVMLLMRAFAGIWQASRPQVTPKIEKISQAVRDARSRAWTRAVWRGPLAQEAR